MLKVVIHKTAVPTWKKWRATRALLGEFFWLLRNFGRLNPNKTKGILTSIPNLEVHRMRKIIIFFLLLSNILVMDFYVGETEFIFISHSSSLPRSFIAICCHVKSCSFLGKFSFMKMLVGEMLKFFFQVWLYPSYISFNAG